MSLKFASFLVVGLALASVACGGKDKAGAKYPGAGKIDQSAHGGPGAVFTPQGQQFAVTDAPSSGESASGRPKMNASASQAYAAGMDAFKAGDLAAAREQFTKATEADAQAYQAFYSLGVVKERLNESSGAASAYKGAIAVVADYEPAIYSLGVLLARDGKASEAESFLNGKAAKMPKSAAVPAALAEVKSIQGDSNEAQQFAKEALKKNPDFRPAMVTIARDHYRKRRLDLALYTLKAILDGHGDENPARDKNNADARLLRGLIYREQNNKAGAIDDFKRAVETRPDLVEARIQLASYVLEAGNAFEAANLLEGALKYDKNHVLARLNLGDAYRLLGKAEQAKKELEWVASKDSSLAQVHYNLGLLYLFSDNLPGVTPKGSVEKAITELELYKKMKPKGKPGERDDTDELITRAKTRKAVLEEEAKSKSKPAAKPATTPPAKPATTPPAAGTKPSTGGMPPAGGTPAKPPAGGTSTGKLPAPGEKK
ncbi:MAG: tetratricopeptide repeat protein [Polyangiaceae bacterium]|nr:tetratricopeptide repeat protein [Polyangiaceae bacterium]